MVAITKVEFGRDGRSVSHSSGTFTANEPVRVYTDLALDPGGTTTADPLFFIGDPLFPAIGASHPAQTNLRLKNFGRAEQNKKDKRIWDFTLIYTSDQPTIAEQSGDSNYKEDEFVDTLIAKKSWGFKTIEIPRRPTVVSDDNGTTWTTEKSPVQTTAGEPVPANESKFLPVLTYTRNELSTPAAILSLVGSVNSDAITLDGLSVGIREALISNVTVSEWKRDQTYQFRTVVYTLMIDEATWDLRMLNRGFYVKAANEDPVVAELPAGADLKKVPVKSPQLLSFTAGTDADDFDGSITALIPPATVLSGTDWYHERRYKHPQITPFTAYGFR